MKKIMIASLGLSLLAGTAVFAQNTSTGSSTMSGTDSGMSKTKKSKKSKKSKGTDGSTMSGSTTSTSTSK